MHRVIPIAVHEKEQREKKHNKIIHTRRCVSVHSLSRAHHTHCHVFFSSLKMAWNNRKRSKCTYLCLYVLCSLQSTKRRRRYYTSFALINIKKWHFLRCAPERTKTYYIRLGCRCREWTYSFVPNCKQKKIRNKTHAFRITRCRFECVCVCSASTHTAERAMMHSRVRRFFSFAFLCITIIKQILKIRKIGEKQAKEREHWLEPRGSAAAINCYSRKIHLFDLNFYYCGNLECDSCCRRRRRSGQTP